MPSPQHTQIFDQEFLAELDKCAACATCHTVCPVYNLTKDDTLSARGRIHLLKALAEGKLDASSIGKNVFHRCLLCYACETACPSGVKTSLIWIKAREYFARIIGAGWKGAAIRSVSHWNRLNNLLKTGRRLQEILPSLRSQEGAFRPQIAERFLLNLLPDTVPAKIHKRYRVGYFVGCISNFFLGNIGLAAIDTLSALGCEVVIPKDQVCCGAPAFNNGEMNAAVHLAQRNVQAFLAAEVDFITSADATCGGAFVHEYNQLLTNDPDYNAFSRKYREIHGLILELGLDGNLLELPAKITYHDSCHLRHTQGVRTAPRAILKSLPGVDLVEMEGSELCCGFGGSYSLFHAAEATAITQEKLNCALSSGASEIAAGSPGCILKLQQEANIHKVLIKVKHTIEFIYERLPVIT